MITTEWCRSCKRSEWQLPNSTEATLRSGGDDAKSSSWEFIVIMMVNVVVVMEMMVAVTVLLSDVAEGRNGRQGGCQCYYRCCAC